MRDAAGFLAVSDPVADLLVRRWKAVAAARASCSTARPRGGRMSRPRPVSARLHEAAGISPERPIVLYQGGFSVDRGVEELVAAIDQHALRELDAAAVFMGYGRLQGFLDDAARAHPDRVYVLPAVPPDELLGWTAGADVASWVSRRGRSTSAMNLPNKLFESDHGGRAGRGLEGQRAVPPGDRGGPGPLRGHRRPGRRRARDRRADAPAGRASGSACATTARAWRSQRYTWDGTAGDLVTLYRRLAAA